MISFRNSEALFPRTHRFPRFSPKVLHVKGHCSTSYVNKQTWASGPKCMQKRIRKPSAFLFSEETNTIHLLFSPTLLKLYNSQLRLHCVILLKISMIFSMLRRCWFGHSLASSAHVPQIPPFASSVLLCSSAGTLLLRFTQHPNFLAPGVAFKIEYVSGWFVFWEVAGSPSCDSCL